jgi:hypothetical protein
MFETVDDIEYNFNLVFLPEIRNKYNDEIIQIFNDDLSNYSVYEINDHEINIIVAIYYNCKGNLEKAINILLGINHYPRALCTLGVFYKKNNDDKSLECFINAANMGDINAVNNLAYQYYLSNNISMFHQYNNLLDDEKKSINLALYELNINHNYTKGVEYIKKAFEYNSYRAYYIYAMDFIAGDINNIDEFYKHLFIGIKLKPMIKYIQHFINTTSTELRFLLCHKFDYPIESFSKYDNSISNVSCRILKDKTCPVCLSKKELNIKLSCNHLFCDLCLMKHKKCIMCK